MCVIEVQKPMEIKPEFLDSTLFQALSPTEINGFLASGATLVTANQRLSRFRLGNYEKEQIKAKKTAWDTPNILSWQTWLQGQWQEHTDGMCLSPQQESLLWRASVLEDEATQVLNPKALSKQAMDAWQILADYHIDASCLQHSGEEHQALWRWAQAVQQKVKQLPSKHPYYQKHEILDHLCSKSVINAENIIILDGFDIFSPAQIYYLQHLQQAGQQVYHIQSHASHGTAHLQSYQDEDDEIRQVCQQIRAVLAQSPEASIGVFVPDLEQRASHISRIFREELAPALSLDSNTDAQGAFFNISLGSVLGKQGMIQAAFALLTLTIKPKLLYQDVSALLLNPYIIGFTEESTARAQLDADLRKNNNHHLSLSQLLKICKKSDINIPIFHQYFSQLHQQCSINQGFNDKNKLSHWVVFAESLLNQFLWCEQATSSHEHTQAQNWRDMMHQLTMLDDFCEWLSWSEAVGRLQEYAFEQLFRPAPGLANIQIMGLLEAANLHFDHAFVISMDDHTWPPAAKPHPLIPVDIQVKHQTPHANSEREWVFAQSVWQHILQVSPQLRVSYAKTRDKQDMQPSPLLTHIAIQTTEPLASFSYGFMLQHEGAALHDIQDQRVAVTADEQPRGGTGLIQSQSACAFQAFAQYRLHLNNIETPSNGLNPQEQGKLLHKALEIFWSKHKLQQTLLNIIKEGVLEQAIKQAVEQAWSDITREVPIFIKHLEENRLQHLLQQWLTFESTRPDFTASNVEVWRDITLGSHQTLKLHTKIDRIDKDAHGQSIIIDYKTGEPKASKALGERPDEPQLPMYYVAEKALGADMQAIAFAQVRNFDTKFQGFAQEAGILPQIKAFKGNKDQPQDWEELTAQWHEVLNRLADEFLAGEADIAPKSSQSCNYCELVSLCRFTAS